MTALRALRSLPSAAGKRSFTSSSALANVARLQIVGRLGASPELTQTAAGREMVRYSIATNSGPRDNRETSWFNVAYFPSDNDNDALKGYLTGLEKGSMVFVEADARMRNIETANGGSQKVLNLLQRSISVLTRPQRDAEGEDAET